MIDQIANEIILSSLLLHTNSVARIAENLGYQPILIMNALYAGERDSKFTYVKKKDIINLSEGIETSHLMITSGLRESQDQIETFITNQNRLQTDLTIEELHAFIPNLPEFHLKLAISSSRELATYEISDPKDKKSVYTFVTLKINEARKFGQKQFDATKPSTFAKHAKGKK